jgi:hypothetical protein
MQNPPQTRWAAGTRALYGVCYEWEIEEILKCATFTRALVSCALVTVSPNSVSALQWHVGTKKLRPDRSASKASPDMVYRLCPKTVTPHLLLKSLVGHASGSRLLDAIKAESVPNWQCRGWGRIHAKLALPMQAQRGITLRVAFTNFSCIAASHQGLNAMQQLQSGKHLGGVLGSWHSLAVQ